METEELSPRKKQIIECLKEGCISDEEIAESLKISVNTAESHIQQLYSWFCIEGKAKRAKLVWEIMRYLIRIIKRIIKLCKDVLEQETDPLNSSEISFAQKILQVLELFKEEE